MYGIALARLISFVESRATRRGSELAEIVTLDVRCHAHMRHPNSTSALHQMEPIRESNVAQAIKNQSCFISQPGYFT